MQKKVLGLAAALTLFSSIALAAPQSGVYQQMYADGRLKNVVTILHNSGAGDYMAQHSMGDNTYVCFDALDNNGYETENFASKLEETGNSYTASEKCYVIDAANLTKCNQEELFKVDAVKKQGPVISFVGEDRLTVSGTGSKYDGEYYFSPRSKPQANNALMLYAYETTKNVNLFEEGTGVNTYRIHQYDYAPWVKRIELHYKDGSQGDYSENVLMDNEFNIVMRCITEGNASYKPFFVSDKYVQWAENGLAAFKTSVGGDESSLYMHRYLAKTFPELTNSNNMTLVLKDFYSGEGENAVSTRLYDLVKDADGVQVLAASVAHSDNGAMQVQKYPGSSNITGDEVHSRKEPNTDSDILGYGNKGDLVEALGAVVQVSDKIEYVKISPDEAVFRDKRTGNSMYVVEDRKQGLYKITCMEDTYKDVFKLDETWQGFKGSRDTVANVGYVNNCMHDVESGYMDEVAYHSYHQVKDIGDGVGTLPNHHETHYIFNDIDGKMLLAATCKVSNKPSTEFRIYGGYKFINGTEVRMRQAPNLNGEIIGYFNQNERVYVYGYANIDYNAPLPNGWAYVKRENGQVGCVAAQFVQ